MKNLSVFDPSTLQTSFHDGSDPRNFAISVPFDTVVTLRNSMMHNSVRSALQQRPYYYFNGPAEQLILRPLTMIAGQADQSPVMTGLMKWATSLMTTARVYNQTRSSVQAGTLASMYGAMLPNAESNAISFIAKNNDPERGDPTLPINTAFANYYYKLIADPTVRNGISKILLNNIKPNMYTAASSDIDIDTEMSEVLQKMLVFGTAGRMQPIPKSDMQDAFRARFAVEESLYFPADVTVTQSDSIFSLALMFLVYHDMTATPQAYDAAWPVLDTTPSNTATIGALLTKMGSMAKTLVSVSQAPMMVNLGVANSMHRDLLEFLKPFTAQHGHIISKIERRLDSMESIAGAIEYAPTKHLRGGIINYLKSLTGARYLLPEWAMAFRNTAGDQPFSSLSSPDLDYIVPDGFQGYERQDDLSTEFNSLDVESILNLQFQKLQELSLEYGEAQSTYDAIAGSLPSPSGMEYHLPPHTLRVPEDDPAIFNQDFDYPKPDKTYYTPSYVPKYKIGAENGQVRFALDDLLYTPFFPNKYKLDKLTENIQDVHYAWDSRVDITVNVDTGAEFATLPIPRNYLSDCVADEISNDINSVSALLSRSNQRPASTIMDYYTPLFEALVTGSQDENVIANAIAGVFLLYRNKGGDAWEIVRPNVPFIYGASTESYLAANSINGSTDYDTEAPAANQMITSRDRRYRLVLVRYAPVPQEVRYFPWLLFSGFPVSVPVPKAIFDVLSEEYARKASGYDGDVFGYYATQLATRSNFEAPRFREITGWSQVFATFPHLFFSNRRVNSAASVAESYIAELTTRLMTAGDNNYPVRRIIKYRPMGVSVLDIEDMQHALTSNELIFLSQKSGPNGDDVTIGDVGPDEPVTRTQAPDNVGPRVDLSVEANKGAHSEKANIVADPVSRDESLGAQPIVAGGEIVLNDDADSSSVGDTPVTVALGDTSPGADAPVDNPIPPDASDDSERKKKKKKKNGDSDDDDDEDDKPKTNGDGDEDSSK